MNPGLINASVRMACVSGLLFTASAGSAVLAQDKVAQGNSADVAPALDSSEQDGMPGLPDVDHVIADAPDVRAAAARLDAARAHARQLDVGSYEVNVQGTYDRRRIIDEGNPAADYNEYSLTASRPIRLPGKAKFDRKAGRFEIVGARNMLADAWHQTALSLASDWYDLASASEQVSILEKAVVAQQQLVSAVDKRVALKDAAPLDADRARIELSSVQSQLAQAKAQVARAKAVLSARYPGLPLTAVPSRIPLSAPSETMMAAWRQHMLEDSHEMRAAQAEVDRQSALADRARANRVPDPTVGVRAFSEQGGHEKGLGLQLSVPLPGRYRAAVSQQALADSHEAVAQLAQVRREVLMTADADLADAQGALATWRVSRAGLSSAQDATSRLLKGYRLGGVDLADVLYARRQQRDAQVAEATARAQAARAITKLRIDAHEMWAAPSAIDPE